MDFRKAAVVAPVPDLQQREAVEIFGQGARKRSDRLWRAQARLRRPAAACGQQADDGHARHTSYLVFVISWDLFRQVLELQTFMSDARRRHERR